MKENILTVLVPAYNSLEGVIRIVDSIKSRKNVGLIVSDDSSDSAMAGAIKAYVNNFKRSDYSYIKHESTGNAVDNWNSLLSSVESKFFVFVHHDETFSNTLFIDEIEKCQEFLELMVLPVRIEHSNGVFRNVKSTVQSMLIKLLKNRSPTLNFIGGPTALLIIKSSNVPKFNRDLIYYVDVDWYVKVFSNVTYKNIKFFSKTTVVSTITNFSITKKIFPRMKETILSDLSILKKHYPGNVFLKWSMEGEIFKVVYKLILAPSFASFYFRKIKSFLLG
tara:strand:- start:741 stop:1574 length:834 start_codon:yes stop_codon:yes gene_type:complete